MISALLKDTLREIKGSMGRFLSIFAIIALGCGFFAGIKATMPDMVDTAEAYFADHSLMDIKLQSSIGVRSEDVSAVRAADNVETAAAGYSKDVFYYYESQNLVMKVMSLPKGTMGRINSVELLEGRLPDKSGECVVERKTNCPDTFVIGEKLTLTSPSESEDIGDIFTTDTFEIVGIVASPLYIGYERDHTTVGNGNVLCYIMIPEQDFVLPYYSELFIRFDGVSDLDPFSDEYKDAVAEKKTEAVKAFQDSVNSRYNKIKQQAETQISNAKDKLGLLEKMLSLTAEEMDNTIKTGREKLKKAQADYDALENKSSVTALLTRSKLLQAEKQLEALGELYEAEINGDSSVRERYAAQISEANISIASAEQELSEITELKFYEQDRFSYADYASFRGDADKIDAIAKVFPAFFILIVALVTLTTMTRMIDEHRTQIGTYKALGYSSFKIASKYLIYAFLASVTGSVLGTVLGLQIFPAIIYDSYKILYNIPSIDTPFRLSYMLLCMAAAVLCTGSAVMYAGLRSLRAQPSALMRPRAPASGRRVVLERVSFIWNRLSFLMKVTIRNLLRYKKRFLMTTAGVAGCAALIITGFALKSSIKTIAAKQFNEIYLFDATVVLNADNNTDADKALTYIQGFEYVDKAALYSAVTCEGRANGVMQSVDIVAPKDPEHFTEYITMKSVDSGEDLSLKDGEIFVTEKLSMLLDLSEGSMINVTLDDGTRRDLKVTAVIKNYALHYIYMTPETYMSTFGQEPAYKQLHLFLKQGADEDAFKQKVVSDKQFLGLVLKGESSRGFLNSVDSLDKIVILLIVCAGLLAVIVLYNLANINITERVREIATIKVLGFFDGETSAYIYRENIISTLIGMIIGVFLGKLLHYFVVITAEVDIVLFNRELVWWAYLAGTVITAAFAALVNFVLHFKLKRIDMVESLKSVE